MSSASSLAECVRIDTAAVLAVAALAVVAAVPAVDETIFELNDLVVEATEAVALDEEFHFHFHFHFLLLPTMMPTK